LTNVGLAGLDIAQHFDAKIRPIDPALKLRELIIPAKAGAAVFDKQLNIFIALHISAF